MSGASSQTPSKRKSPSSRSLSPRAPLASRGERDFLVQRLRVAAGVVLRFELLVGCSVVERVELRLAQERRRIQHLDAAEREAFLVENLRVVIRNHAFGS